MNGRLNRHLVRLLLALYPRAWRDRYGAEVVRLTEELIRAGETTPAQGALNLAAAAIAERGRALADSRRTVAAMAVAALIAVAGGFYATAHARPPGPASAPGAASALTAPASLARVLCVYRLATGTPRRVVIRFGPGHAGAPAMGGKWQARCVKLPARCHLRLSPSSPPGVPVPVAVKPGQCVIAVPEPAAPGT